MTRAVAAKRRSLPPGGEVDDYRFGEGPRDVTAADVPSVIRLDELFAEHPTVMLYNFMFDGSTRDPCLIPATAEGSVLPASSAP